MLQTNKQTNQDKKAAVNVGTVAQKICTMLC